ncbi:MAG: hypothetical protein K0Q94_2365 [Paenibacillus sp.]|jgi:hypothetical protein|nr:hypothetical protein [Paenibacillus sp.]
MEEYRIEGDQVGVWSWASELGLGLQIASLHDYPPDLDSDGSGIRIKVPFVEPR